MFEEGLFRSEYEICAYCGNSHANDKTCPGLKVVKKKKHTPWICNRINMEMSYPVFDLEEEEEN